VNAVNNYKCTSLHVAIYNENIEAIEILLKNGAKVNSSEKNRETALHVAVFYENIEMAKLLLKNDAEVK